MARPGKALLDTCVEISNKPGRLGILVEALKVASRIAKKQGAKLSDDHVFGAIKLREQITAVQE